MGVPAADFVLPWRARYYEIDQQGVVFNAWYLAWFDEAMSAFLADRGLGGDAMVAAGFDVQLVRSEIDWRDGVRWGDSVEIVVRPGRIGTTSFDVHFCVRRDGRDTCTARIVYVSIASDGSGKTPVPSALRAVLTGETSETGSAAAVELSRRS
ncbi:acyl-CoA thioesterase [Cryptosporangium minutisporangium]|uniref:Thioesterase family protein n=1 Tax=Cryptosporangium minutisporangium TaxID=113569 RepID=A0ABP6SSG5_9ACTN